MAQKNQLQRDFTQGSIPWHLISFSTPIFLGSLLQAFYSTVDSIWVGRFIGSDALGAVSISFPLIMALLALIMGLTMATTTMIAQFRGMGNEEMVRRTVASSMILLTIVGTMLSVIGAVFRYPLLALVDPPAEIRKMAADYFGIFMAGILGMFLYNTLTAILRGLGDSRTPLKYLAVATLLNIIIDPLLILGIGPFPKMGVPGAAVATIVSQGLSSVLLYRWVAKNTNLLPTKREEWRMDLALVRTVVKVGLPAGVQQMVVSFAMVVVTAIISGFGKDVVAAFGAASRLDQFGFMPAMTIGMAVTSMVGQNLGANRLDRVHKSVRWSAGLALGLTSLITLVAIVNPTILIVLFTDDPTVLTIGAEYLRFMGPAYLFFSLIFVLGGVMRGAGDTVPPMIFSIAALWVARVPLVWALSRHFGTMGIWLGIALSSVIGYLLHQGYYLTGRWLKHRMVTGQPVLSTEECD